MVKKLSAAIAFLLAISCNSLFCQEIVDDTEIEKTETVEKNISFLNSPWLPDFKNFKFDYNNIYLEADFNFVVPVLFYGGGLTGVGFSPKFEAGYNWDGWLLGLRYSYSTSLDGSTSITSNIDIYKNSVTLQISKTIDKSLLAFMPSFLQAKPYVGLGVDIISGSYVFNENNCTYNVFGAGFIFNLGLAAELVNFPTITNYATPSVGMEFDFTPDKNGLAFAPSFYIGARTDAKRVIEIVNTIKTAIENKKSAKSTEPAATEEEPAVEQTETPVEEKTAPVEEPEATVTSTEQNEEAAAINTEAAEAEQTTEPLTTPPEPTVDGTESNIESTETTTDATTSTTETIETEPAVEQTAVEEQRNIEENGGENE